MRSPSRSLKGANGTTSQTRQVFQPPAVLPSLIRSGTAKRAADISLTDSKRQNAPVHDQAVAKQAMTRAAHNGSNNTTLPTSHMISHTSHPVASQHLSSSIVKKVRGFGQQLPLVQQPAAKQAAIPPSIFRGPHKLRNQRLGVAPKKSPTRATLIDAEISPARPGKARKFLLERLRTHLQSAAAAAAEAWAEGLAQYEEEVVASAAAAKLSQESDTKQNGQPFPAAGVQGSFGSAWRQQKHLKGAGVPPDASMAEMINHGLSARAGAGRQGHRAGGAGQTRQHGEEAAAVLSLAKKLWVAEHVLSVETEWQRCVPSSCCPQYRYADRLAAVLGSSAGLSCTGRHWGLHRMRTARLSLQWLLPCCCFRPTFQKHPMLCCSDAAIRAL